MASARFDDHVAVLLQNDIGVVVEVEDGYGRQFDGSAAGFRHTVRVHQMN